MLWFEVFVPSKPHVKVQFALWGLFKDGNVSKCGVWRWACGRWVWLAKVIRKKSPWLHSGSYMRKERKPEDTHTDFMLHVSGHVGAVLPLDATSKKANTSCDPWSVHRKHKPKQTSWFYKLPSLEYCFIINRKQLRCMLKYISVWIPDSSLLFILFMEHIYLILSRKNKCCA